VPALLTVTEAADHFKVSTATIRRWIRSGRVSSQLTLGPFGEQWMIDSESLRDRDGSAEHEPQRREVVPAAGGTSAFVPVDQLIRHNDSDSLLQEAESALKEAWQAREAAEKRLAEQQARSAAEIAELRSQLAQPLPDLVALRSDLEGSERQRLQLERELKTAHAEHKEAWDQARSALQALGEAYARLEVQDTELVRQRSELECLRRAFAQRLGLDWTEHDVLSLFVRWELLHQQPQQPRPGRTLKSWSDARSGTAGTQPEQAAGE
jgi:hypothetical protein